MAGFYKVINGKLINAPTRVRAPGYSLSLKNKNDAVKPDGWQYFDTDEAAYTFFGAAVDRTKDLLNEINTVVNDEVVREKVSKLSIALGKGALSTIK